MPSSFVTSFKDPDDYAVAIRGTDADMTVTGGGRFESKLTRIDLHELWMQRFSDSIPRVIHSASGLQRAAIVFKMSEGPSLYWNGMEMLTSSIIQFRDNHDSFQRSTGPASFAAMSLPSETMRSVSAALSGRDLESPLDDLLITPAPATMAKLAHLHSAATTIADRTPGVLAHGEAARGLEQALVGAMVACLAGDRGAEDTAARRRTSTVMRRFHKIIAEHPGEAIYIPDVCIATGVSHRTLNAICHERFGVSPKRYLQLRRMHLARRSLRKADPILETVTDIASSFGFWNFGRFAVEYRALFGESPSATLRGPR